ncbi:MerR family transcriptional regulator [Membranihabitans marinus]|uniref:MerR family transcriptional regulator n=1 Tax=Membranihabitans marinus TaxID=1227546 RepID=UPI001F02E363|nr:MerR family transcriptional regulator [Membranihabitans marinus]
MSRYTVSQIVELTGINAHTLRKWESRYSFISPERTETNIRFYSDEDLKKLLNVLILTNAGYRLSKINKMSDEEIFEKVRQNTNSSEDHDEISLLILSMLDFDELGFDKIIRSSINRRGILTTITTIIYPFLNQVGVLWGTNKVMPAQEHFISNLIRQKITSAIEMLPIPRGNPKKMVLFLPEFEYHELGLLLANYLAKEMQWRTYYLGQNVPTENIIQVVKSVEPDFLFTIFISPISQRLNTVLETITKEVDVQLLASGTSQNAELLQSFSNVKFIAHPQDLVVYLTEKES